MRELILRHKTAFYLVAYYQERSMSAPEKIGANVSTSKCELARVALLLTNERKLLAHEQGSAPKSQHCLSYTLI